MENYFFIHCVFKAQKFKLITELDLKGVFKVLYEQKCLQYVNVTRASLLQAPSAAMSVEKAGVQQAGSGKEKDTMLFRPLLFSPRLNLLPVCFYDLPH